MKERESSDKRCSSQLFSNQLYCVTPKSLRGSLKSGDENILTFSGVGASLLSMFEEIAVILKIH